MEHDGGPAGDDGVWDRTGDGGRSPWERIPAGSGAAAPDPAGGAARMRLIVESALDGMAAARRNLCSLVGTLRVMPAQSFQDAGRYVLEVNEVLTGEGGIGMATCAYQLEVSIGGRLADPTLLREGARVAISGALRMERVQGVTGEDGLSLPTPPTWEVRLDAIAVTSVDATTPDGSWVQLEGQVAHPPVVRERSVGPGTVVTVVQTHLRSRAVMQSAFVGGGRYVHLTMTPVEGSLDEETPDMAALLLPDNLVRLEGRLVPTFFRRRAQDPRVAAAIRRMTEHVRRHERGETAARRLQAAINAYLHGVRMVVGAGRVELVRGRMPGGDEQRRIIKAARRGQAAQALTRPLAPEAVRSALDAAQAAWWASRRDGGGHAAAPPAAAPRRHEEDGP